MTEDQLQADFEKGMEDGYAGKDPDVLPDRERLKAYAAGYASGARERKTQETEQPAVASPSQAAWRRGMEDGLAGEPQNVDLSSGSLRDAYVAGFAEGRERRRAETPPPAPAPTTDPGPTNPPEQPAPPPPSPEPAPAAPVPTADAVDDTQVAAEGEAFDLSQRLEPDADGVVWRGAKSLRQHLRPIDTVKPMPGNSRRGDVPALMKSLMRFGQVRAVTATEDDLAGADVVTLVAGHHVTKAARALGWTHIAVVPAEFESRDEARAYLVADNQLGSLGHVEQVDQMTLLEEIDASGRWEGTGFTHEDLEDARALAQHKTEMVRAKSLKAHPGNYKEHDARQREHLIASLREHGVYKNIVVANDGTVLAGHGIWEAAQEVGLHKIPVTRMPFGPDDPRALKIIAGDNELGKLAEVDDRVLTETLRKVKDSGDVSALLGTGYDAQTLASLVMVSRPRSEIADFDAAAEWAGAGMPDFAPVGEPRKLIISCETDEQRQEVIDKLGLKIAKNTVGTLSAWWPPREQEDLSSLRWEAAEGGEQATMFDIEPEKAAAGSAIDDEAVA